MSEEGQDLGDGSGCFATFFDRQIERCGDIEIVHQELTCLERRCLGAAGPTGGISQRLETLGSAVELWLVEVPVVVPRTIDEVKADGLGWPALEEIVDEDQIAG